MENLRYYRRKILDFFTNEEEENYSYPGRGKNSFEETAKVFICYAREDEGFAVELAETLKKNDVSVWIDRWKIPVGGNWSLLIDDAIQECTHFLVLISPAALKSNKVTGEWLTALDKGKNIIPARYKCQIPSPLRIFQYIDFTDRGVEDEKALEDVLFALKKEDSASYKKEEMPWDQKNKRNIL